MRAVIPFIFLFPTLAFAAPQAAASVRTWYEIIKDFQTLIAAALGFTGVIITMIVQGRQARAQRRSEAETAAKSMKEALDAEIATLSLQLNTNAKYAEEHPTQEGNVASIPAKPINHLFQALLPKFEQLPPAEVTRITRANMFYEQYLERLLLLGTPSRQIPSHVEVEPKYMQVVIELQKNTADWMKNPPNL